MRDHSWLEEVAAKIKKPRAPEDHHCFIFAEETPPTGISACATEDNSTKTIVPVAYSVMFMRCRPGW